MINIKGFTLIELMLVISIIGILFAIALPTYQIYIVKVQLATAVDELNNMRNRYELVLHGGVENNNFTLHNMEFPSSNSCNYQVYAPDETGKAEPALECKLKNVGMTISKESIYLDRNEDGVWKCSTSAGIDNKYKPVDCK